MSNIVKLRQRADKHRSIWLLTSESQYNRSAIMIEAARRYRAAGGTKTIGECQKAVWAHARAARTVLLARAAESARRAA